MTKRLGPLISKGHFLLGDGSFQYILIACSLSRFGRESNKQKIPPTRSHCRPQDFDDDRNISSFIHMPQASS